MLRIAAESLSLRPSRDLAVSNSAAAIRVTAFADAANGDAVSLYCALAGQAIVYERQLHSYRALTFIFMCVLMKKHCKHSPAIECGDRSHRKLSERSSRRGF